MDVNKDIKKNEKNIFIIILFFVFFVSFLFVSNVLASGHLLTLGGVNDTFAHGSSSHVSGDFAGKTFTLSSVGDVFCTEPNRAVIENVSGAYVKITNASDVTKLHYNAIVDSNGKCPVSLTCGSLGTTSINAKIRGQISLVAAYYNVKHSSDANVRKAVQMIIWEYASGGRNNLAEKPSLYSGNNSWYSMFIKDKNDDVAKAYKNALKYAREYIVPKVLKNGGSKKLSWKGTAWSETFEGDYSKLSCSSGNANVTTSNSNSGLTVTSTVYIPESNPITITCSRDDDGVGNGGQGVWYKKDGDKTNDGYYQKLVRGTTPSISGSISVWTEGVKVKVKKVDETGTKEVPGATFSFSTTGKTYSISGNGAEVVVIPGSYTIEETVVPTGYAKMTTLSGINIQPGNDFSGSSGNASYSYSAASNTFTLVVKDIPYRLNWYKDTENGTRAAGAEFKINSGTVYHTANMISLDGKTCYQYSPTSTGAGSDVFVSDANGEVCVRQIPEGNYTVTETKPAQYHTFSDVSSKTISATTGFAPATPANTFINLKTYFEFDKSVSSGDEENVKININGVEKTLHDLTTEELSKIEFNVFDSNNAIVSFVVTTDSDGRRLYSYAGNTIDKPAGNVVTGLYLDDLRKIRIEHLPLGTYSIKEKDTKVCAPNSDYNECVGYYYPNYNSSSSYQFVINECSNDGAKACSSYGKSTQRLINTPTEITFTKKDFYNNYDQADIVDFENDKERSDFDRIIFKLKDANGNYLTLKKVRDVGDCKSDSSYSEYRYVSSDSASDAGGTELKTCGGHIKVTNLCRGNKYTMEEISVPEDSVFVKENTSSTPTSADFNVPCTEPTTGTDTKGSTTNIINNKPTRVRLEKRDSKYNYLIPDETTTFKLYRCKKGEECHPTDYSTDEERIAAGMKLIKFYERGVIKDDEEDPTDAEGNANVEVYKMMSDSDALGTKYVTEVHPYKGILVFRYLQANYNYVLVETVAPKNYQLPVGRKAETTFMPTNKTVTVDSVDVPNKPTSVLIKKYSDDGLLLKGAQFKVYKAKGETCDKNLSAANQDKELLRLKTIRDGVYEARPEEDTDTIVTCTDRDDAKCSDIKLNSKTALTNSKYLNTWADFDDESTSTEDGRKIELQEGEALIQYLEYGHCYIIEETKAPEGYSLPKNIEDRYTMITIKKNDEFAHDTDKTLINKPTPFKFYKYDEFNKLIDGAEFKLQKLDNNKKYQDVTVSEKEENGELFYKVDKDTDNTLIRTKGGTATIYYLTAGQYRILETKAPDGKELPKNPNISTFFVDENGSVYGNPIITNKSITKKIEVKNSASAELIVTIQTGQTVIRYGLVIAVLVGMISGLMILREKKSRKDYNKDEK